jgi:hypothetical protein
MKLYKLLNLNGLRPAYVMSPHTYAGAGEMQHRWSYAAHAVTESFSRSVEEVDHKLSTIFSSLRIYLMTCTKDLAAFAKLLEKF